jgi:hypothetical protein
MAVLGVPNLPHVLELGEVGPSRNTFDAMRRFLREMRARKSNGFGQKEKMNEKHFL